MIVAFSPNYNKIAGLPMVSRSSSTTTMPKSMIIRETTTATSTISSELYAVLQPVELPEKLYMPKEKEGPKVFGGLKIGLRKLVVITGASSGLGLNTAITLANSGRYFIVMACRDVEKGKRGKSPFPLFFCKVVLRGAMASF
jgi:protochlorophyllide reductase